MVIHMSVNIPVNGYTDVVLALNNSKIGYYDDQIYLIDLEIKDTTYVAMLISNIDMCITIDRDVR
jgi:hypothetical protein